MTLILGIDPGSVYTGYGIVKFANNKPIHIISDRISCGRGEFHNRLEQIYTELTELLQSHQPDMIAIESVFVQKNAMSALKLGHARGVAMLACTQSQKKIYEYAPRQIKKAITGYGAAQKAQMQYMMRAILNLNYTPSEDAADALAVAITHGFSSQAHLQY